jgi:hypothetical protein
MLRAASSMIAHALSSAGEVRNGSSRMNEGVRLLAIGQETLVASTGFKPLSVESAFGACALIPRPKGRGTSRFSVASRSVYPAT